MTFDEVAFHVAARHDNDAVDRFAAVMKEKLAAGREKGRRGWENCPAQHLAEQLIGHLSKTNSATNYADLANFCMMLHQRGEGPEVLARIAQRDGTALVALDDMRGSVTDEDLHKSGRYFSDHSFRNLTSCSHGYTGEFSNDADGEVIAILWNAWRAGEIGKHRATVSVSPELALATDILEELVCARAKFPGKNVTFAALVEEVGELATAIFEESAGRVRREAIQVAVMAMRMILDGDHTYEPWRAEKGLDPLDPALRIADGGSE